MINFRSLVLSHLNYFHLPTLENETNRFHLKPKFLQFVRNLPGIGENQTIFSYKEVVSLVFFLREISIRILAPFLPYILPIKREILRFKK